MKDQVTLRPGDYVSTKGLTESQYYKAVEAFEDAGGFRGTPIDYGSRECLLFDDADGEIWGVSTVSDYGGAKRHLTIDQVLSTANAGGQTQGTLTTILEQAAEHDATAKHHAAMHERLMQQAREMLPEGWRLVRAEDMEDGPSMTVVGGEDMPDPENWRIGDVLEIVEASPCDGVAAGDLVVMLEEDREPYVPYCKRPDGTWRDFDADRQLRFHHRP